MTADVRDQFGNLATEATQTLAVHETLPTISIAAIAGDNVVNESEASAGFAITGSETGADGRPVSVAIVDGNGHVVASYTTTASEGSWAVGVTSQQATALADGSYRVTADVTDQFGNAVRACDPDVHGQRSSGHFARPDHSVGIHHRSCGCRRQSADRAGGVLPYRRS